MIRHLAVAASGLSAFVLTCLSVDHAFPRELPWLMREKVAHESAHGDSYDALFVGSSRMENNVMPTIFDRAAAEHGLTIHTFNEGISGMYPPQDAYLLDRILAARPTRLRWVFLELQYLQTPLLRANRDTEEQVHWHDWPRFFLLCQWAVATQNKHRHWRDNASEAVGRLSTLGEHSLLFARRFTGMGRGALLLQRWATHEPAPAMNWRLLGVNGDGWVPAGVGNARDAKTIATLEADLERRREKPPSKDTNDQVTQKAFDLIVAKIERAGATPILIVPPNASRVYFYPRPELAQHLIILDFCDPGKYPELYATENRVDTSHLTPAGAELFSRLLAERFVEATHQRTGASR